jgi:hypothetical protein
MNMINGHITGHHLFTPRISSTFHITGMNVISWMKIFWFFVKDWNNLLCIMTYFTNAWIVSTSYVMPSFVNAWIISTTYVCLLFDALKAWCISTTYVMLYFTMDLWCLEGLNYKHYLSLYCSKITSLAFESYRLY